MAALDEASAWDGTAFANDDCFDCGESCAADPWVCVKHGITICKTCAGFHRSLGVQVSFVRSMKLDTLTADEDASLKRGGNAKMAEFLEAHGLPHQQWLLLEPKALRYFTPQADCWRRRLGGEADAEMRHVDPPDDVERLWKALPAAGAAPSPWTPDADANRCERCKVTFTMFNRRHHCRKCGKCVCGDCSPQACWRDGVRHCKVCVPPPARTIPGLM
mmetsp:Transcript_23139/g.69312  ORF Transcript_23139/g.69312 Transcript_23139/m.69312 type:complete len:218 (+) Transcript_23139:351-1004(+)